MNRMRNFSLLAVGAAAMIGCGGGTTNSTVLPSLYAGTWSGTWTGPLTNDGGALSMTVTSDGSLSGSMARAGGLSGSISGVIDSTGHFTATAGFASSGNFLMNGTVVVLNGNLTGAFNYDWLGGTYQGSFSMAVQGASSSLVPLRSQPTK